jgi:GDPmannose 4,6-dehydratase
MHMMMQQPEADDYVIGTGETHQGKEWAQIAFECVGLNWEDYVKSDQQFMRPAEVDLLIADPSKARKKLGWQPDVSFRQLIEMMVESDLAAESRLQAANA